ncbi:MAG: anthranilate synthase component I [Alphaproteobacteria bacterium]|nr:anthranilate synthase component I [Alphaproteobacteria bacterium]
MLDRFTTPTGLTVERRRAELAYETALDGFAERLDRERGALFSSGVDYPGRYSRWEFGLANPPLEIVGRGRELQLRALNPRGEALLHLLAPIVTATPHTLVAQQDARMLTLRIGAGTASFREEERSLQPSLVSPLRCLIAEFAGSNDPFLGLYGGFGYDLLFQFEPIAQRQRRPADEKELHLFVPDQLVVVDRRKEIAYRLDYEFLRGGESTVDLGRRSFAPVKPPVAAPAAVGTPVSDHSTAEYAAMVDRARERMRVGDIFEVVLSQTYRASFQHAPSALFARLKQVNPSPFEFLIQFGGEQLVGTSPEMFVRVEGERVESCPISGTARRTGNPMNDAENLKALFNSEKDEVELTMCTDVDRNDKSRICRPGTVKLLGRRQIETYAGLFHTVDHVEGRLREGLTGLDAFLSHMWAVTLTGAPKKKAVEIVEESEKGPRGWYGGAVGALMLSGDVSTGITIRTVHLKDGEARYRVGATLVWDSVGAEEDAECRTKATNLFRALAAMNARPAPAVAAAPRPGEGRRVLLIDNEDSFVHTLADYFRQTGAAVETYRHGLAFEALLAAKPDLVVHSPGPGRPEEFGVPALVRRLAAANVAQFGVCLGLQGMVEAFGGALDVLPSPRHGKTWDVLHDGDPLFTGVPSPAQVGAYHSLTARLSSFPHDELSVTARTAEGLVMAVRHRRVPALAVQFHPESILSMRAAERGEIGRRLIVNLVEGLAAPRPVAAVADALS